MNTANLANQGPTGISGWLSLVAFGLLLTPVYVTFQAFQTFSPVFEEGVWQALTSPESEAYNRFWGPLLVGEIAGQALLLLASLGILVVFFQKSRRFPRLFIAFYAASIGLVIVDACAALLVLPDEPVFDPDTVKQLAKSGINAAIWIPYMLVSKRVKNTFVNGPDISPSVS